MKNLTLNFNGSTRLLLLSSFIILLVSFGGVVHADSPLFELHYFFFIKLVKSVACFSVFLYWHFIRQSNNAELSHNDFRRWQVGALLLLQGAEGALSLKFGAVAERQWITSVSLVLSGALFYSLYYSYVIKRLADTLVLSAVGLVFVVLISYSLNGNANVVPLTDTNVYTACLALMGCVALFSISVISAQFKMYGYSEFELFPVVLIAAGYLDFVGLEQFWLWWGASAFQILLIILLVITVVKVNRQTSVDWSMFDAGFNLSRHAYFLGDMNGKIRFVNSSYRSLFGISESLPITKIKHPLYTHPLEQSISDSLDSDRVWEGETVLMHKSGKVTSVFANITKIEINGVEYQHGWFQDIHEKVTFKETQTAILDKLERLSLDLMEKQEDERSYFAKELHDEIGQGLTLLKIQHQLPEPDKDLITSVLSELIDKVRNLSLNLRPAILDDMGLSPALNWLVDRQKKFSQLSITADIHSNIPRLSDKLEISVFRIAQEAFTNIHKYSHADKVSISCHIVNGYLQLSISDNGVGFDIDAKLSRANQGQSLGLLGLRERALLVNGLMDIESTPESGTKVNLRAPITIQSTEAPVLNNEEFKNV